MRLNKLPRKTVIKILIGLGALVVLVLLIAAGGLFFPEEEQTLAPPLRQPDAVEYKTFTVKKATIENTIDCQAYFYPEKQVDIAFANREGFLKAIYVRYGQAVAAGQLLASLDTDTLANEIKRQALVLDEARDELARLKAVSGPDISGARLQLEELRQDLGVKNQLKDNLPLIEIKRLENQVKLQELAVQKLSLDYEFRIAAAARDIEKAQLKLNELELELDKSVLRAPVAGRIIYLAPLNQGEHVPPYKTMASLADPQRLILKYSGEKYDKFRLGMKVKVLHDGKTYNGEVVLTPLQVPEEDFEKMKQTVYVKPMGLPAGVNIDDSATVEATLERRDNVIVLPRRLVHTYGNRSFVKVLENGIVNERDVKTGIDASLEMEITGGLEPGELVVE